MIKEDYKIKCNFLSDCGKVDRGCCSKFPKLNPDYDYCVDCKYNTYKEDIESKSIGLGDTVMKVIKIATLGKIRPKQGCGCNKRRNKLNRLFPYKKNKD